jgi:hypothetical protein
MRFACAMATPAGRGVRILAGLALIVAGAVTGGAGYVMIPVGIVPLWAGATNHCLIAPLIRAPFRGSQARPEPTH